MKYIKDNYKFYIFMIIICIIGGYFTTLYSLSYLDPEVIKEGIEQTGSKELLIAISVMQITLYTAFFAGIGIILSNKIGLWKKKFEKNEKAIKITTILAVIAGLSISLVDRYIFGSFIEPVRESFNSKPTIEYIISAFTYGGVFEEILMRLFLMSLFAWLISKIFYRKSKKIPTKVFVISNIVTALLFAVGHLPSTYQIFGYLNTLILVRCFLLNGSFGLAFGWLYRKYGIQYSMLAHFGSHLVEIIIRLLFI